MIRQFLLSLALIAFSGAVRSDVVQFQLQFSTNLLAPDWQPFRLAPANVTSSGVVLLQAPAGIQGGFFRMGVTATPVANPQPGMLVPIATDTDEEIRQAIHRITTFPTELDSRLWAHPERNDSPMKPDVRDRTVQIVERLFNRLNGGLPAGISLGSIELFGSNASYEWDKDGDFGVHVFINSTNYSQFPQNQLESALRTFNAYVEMLQEPKIRFRDVVVEVTFHSEPRTSSYVSDPGKGQYMIKDYVGGKSDSWIQVPSVQPNRFDTNQMFLDAKKFIAKYNALATEYAFNKLVFDANRFDELDDEMGSYRSLGFSSYPDQLGNRSTQNLTYRMLRRISVNIPDTVDLLDEDCGFVQDSLY